MRRYLTVEDLYELLPGAEDWETERDTEPPEPEDGLVLHTDSVIFWTPIFGDTRAYGISTKTKELS